MSALVLTAQILLSLTVIKPENTAATPAIQNIVLEVSIMQISKDIHGLTDVKARDWTKEPWAEGLVLRADGYECEFYKKD